MQHADALEWKAVSQVPPNDDSRLIERLTAGDRAALSDLYVRYHRTLFRYVCQLTPDESVAEEILQDTLVAIWQSARSFEGRSSLLTWLIGVARRQAHNTLRRRGLPLAEPEALESVEDPQQTPDEHVLERADREDVARAVARLAPIYREVLALTFVQGLSYHETATVLGVPEGTVKSRLSNAKRALRSLLEPERRPS